jgi:aminoglycoside 3-N-acetyltransferase
LWEEDIVVAHSSLSSFGWVEGGADAVIDALISVVGPTGTVCMPALSWGPYNTDNPPPPFDARTEPCRKVGCIPETFRQRPGVLRSLHPTHSMTAIGGRAEELLKNHDLSPTPCGPDSPWGRIAKNRGYALMIGCGTFRCTMFHGPEEEGEPDVRCTPPVRCRFVTEDGERVRWLRFQQRYTGAVMDRKAMEPVLEAAGLLRRATVGSSTLLLIEARGLWELGLRMVRENPGQVVTNGRWGVRSAGQTADSAPYR